MNIQTNNLGIDVLPYGARKFVEWLNDAPAWDHYIYYRGHLAESRVDNLLSIKQIVWDYAVRGRVYLFQKKIGPGEYDYIAYKVGIRNTKLIPFDYWNEGRRPRITRKKDG